MNNKVLCPVSSKSGEQYRLTVGKDDALVQIHRQNKWIDFSAIGVALKLLSDEALRLYMYLVKLPLDYPWALFKSVIEKEAQLSIERYEIALAELMEKGYLTPGNIHLLGKDYKTNCYHFWESPALRQQQAS